MKLSIFTTASNATSRGDNLRDALQCYVDLADEVICMDGGFGAKDGEGPNGKRIAYKWPQEFSWVFIGQQFQRGYEACTGDWVIKCDLDYIFHEKDFGKIRQALKDYPNAPGVSFYKWQFIQPDRYNLKSRLVIAVNKKMYGDRIKFNGGGDLCNVTLDDRLLDLNEMPQSGVPFYNFEKLCKTEEQIKDDAGRMARAWQRHFGEYKLGGPDDESAYEEWWKMTEGRFEKPQEQISIDKLPKYIQETIKNLKPEQFGYNGFGRLR